MLLVSTVLVPLSIFLLPFCKVVEALGVVLALMGINMGCIDCLANLQVIRLYGNYVAPFLQVRVRVRLLPSLYSHTVFIVTSIVCVCVCVC